MATFLANVFTCFLDLLLPEHCAGCASPATERPASSPRAATDVRPRGPLCAACQAPLTGPPRRAWPAPRPAALPPPWSVATYEGPVRAMLIAYKEAGRITLAKPLGAALARAVHTALQAHVPPLDEAHAPAQVLIVPVPSTPRAVRRRGHDPIRGLAEVAVRRSRAAGLPVTCEAVLRQSRTVADQAGLGATARAANLAGALRVTASRRIHGRRIIVVDDVITSGATLTEAARALRAAGAQVIAAATIAATPRRHP